MPTPKKSGHAVYFPKSTAPAQKEAPKQNLGLLYLGALSNMTHKAEPDERPPLQPHTKLKKLYKRQKLTRLGREAWNT
jgi:hypothetical protein